MDSLWSILMFFGSSFCHQIPDRSYLIGDLQMPLCARCIGIQLGFLLSSLFIWTGPRKFTSGMLGKRTNIVLATMFFIGGFDAILSYSGISESDNLRRTLSGLLMGTVMPFLLVPLINRIFFQGRNSRIIFGKNVDWAWFAAIYLIGAAMILLATTSPILFSAVSILSVIGLFVLSFTLITLLVLILSDSKGMSGHQRIAISAVSTVAFILVMAVIHILIIPPAWIG